MADTTIGSGDDLAVKRWSDELMRETFGKMAIRGLIGRSNDSPLKLLTDLDRDAGDNIKFDLRQQDRSDGVSGDSVLEGNESAMVFWQDEVNINQKRNAHVFGQMTQQRTVHDLRREARDSMSNWYAWGLEAGFLAHLAGYFGDGPETAEGFLYEGAVAPDPNTDPDVFGNVPTTVDAGHTVASASSFEIGLVEDVVAKAKVMNPRVAPARIDGEMVYILLMHPYSVRSLRSSTDTVDNLGWVDSVRRAAARGEANPLFTGATGKYNNVVMVENEFVPYDTATSTAYNVFLGACGGAIAFGNAWNRMSKVRSNGGGSYWSYIEDVDDYGNRTGFGTGAVPGFKRSIFNGASFGSMLVKSVDAPPA